MVLEEGPAFEPTKRLRGLAAVEDFGVTVAEMAAMGDNGKGVGGCGKIYLLSYHWQIEQRAYFGEQLENIII